MRLKRKAALSLILAMSMMIGSSVPILADEPQTVSVTTTESSVTENQDTESTACSTVTEHKTPKEPSSQTPKKNIKRKPTKKSRKVKKIKKKKAKEEKIHGKIKPKDTKDYKKLSLQIKNNKEYLDGYIYLNQADEAWNQSGYSIHSAGCGPTAVSTCLVNLTKKWITPVDVAAWGYKNGYYSGGGTIHEGIPVMVKHFGLNCQGIGVDYQKIRRSLKNGNMVIGLMGPGYFTKSGHFIVLVSIDKKDQVTICDVGSRSKSQYKYALKEIISESKTAGGGGPFWNVEKPVFKKEVNRSKQVKKSRREKDRDEKKKIITDFYENISGTMNSFEKMLPANVVFVGKKHEGVINQKESEMNQKIYHLGQRLDDPYLIQISKTYDFGVDQIDTYNNKPRDTFNLISYLQKIMK